MTPEQAAAYVQAQAVAAVADIEGMKAENELRRSQGQAIAHSYDEFIAVQDRYCLGHNAILTLYQNAN